MKPASLPTRICSSTHTVDGSRFGQPAITAVPAIAPIWPTAGETVVAGGLEHVPGCQWAWRGPRPRPRDPALRRRRSNSTGSNQVCDDEPMSLLDVVGSLPFAPNARNGSDDEASGGDEQSRQDRLASVRILSEVLQETNQSHEETGPATLATKLAVAIQPHATVGSEHTPAFRIEFQRVIEMFIEGALDLIYNAAPHTAESLQLAIKLLVGLGGSRQPHPGGMQYVREALLKAKVKMEECEGRVSTPEMRKYFCMLPILLLQLQAPRTSCQNNQRWARLTLLARGRN